MLLQAQAGGGRDPKTLPANDVETILRDSLGFGKAVVRFDDARDGVDGAMDREIIAAVNGELTEAQVIGFSVNADTFGIVATIVHTTETCDDSEPSRITSLGRCFKELPNSDAIVFELPQLWIIPDPDFKPKMASIGLYPNSFWMSFLKYWGNVVTAEVFFRTVKRKTSEPCVHLVVKFIDRECMKMCFTFLYDRYLMHPKERALRQPWCYLTSFQEFKSTALAGSKAGKTAPKAKGGASRPKAKVPPAKGAPPAKAAPAAVVSQGIPAHAPAPKRKVTPANATAAPKLASAAKPKDGFDRALTPAEAMHGLSGKQLEAFQMVMTRMERLERENQELMQILLQMQTLLQEQQQRNARLTQGQASVTPSMGNPLAQMQQQMALPNTSMQQVLMGAQTLLPHVAKWTSPAVPNSTTIPQLAPQPPQMIATTSGGIPAGAEPASRPSALGRFASGEKRRAEAAPDTPGLAVAAHTFEAAQALAASGNLPSEAAYYGNASGDAPWKSQRKRQRRTPRPAGKELGGGGVTAQHAGLAAYHDALIGV